MEKEYIASVIKEALKKKGIKQKDFSEKIGESIGVVNKWVNGKACPPGDKLLKIINMLDIQNDIFGNNKSKKYDSIVKRLVSTTLEGKEISTADLYSEMNWKYTKSTSKDGFLITEIETPDGNKIKTTWYSGKSNRDLLQDITELEDEIKKLKSFINKNKDNGEVTKISGEVGRIKRDLQILIQEISDKKN